MSALKVLLITIYSVVSIFLLDHFVIPLLLIRLFSYTGHDSLIIQMVIRAFVVFIVIFPIIKLRKRLFTLSEKLLIIIPLTIFTVILRMSLTYGDGQREMPDSIYVLCLYMIFIAISDFIPVWLIISTHAGKFFKQSN